MVTRRRRHSSADKDVAGCYPHREMAKAYKSTLIIQGAAPLFL
jgi:hypothetical protein